MSKYFMNDLKLQELEQYIDFFFSMSYYTVKLRISIIFLPQHILRRLC
jgi:hypothetical protein